MPALEEPTFALTNTGLTEAQSVTLVIPLSAGAQAFDLGTIPAGETGRAQLVTTMRGPSAAAVLSLQGLRFDVHWSSPLGQADSYHHTGIQLG